jgi:hypothetical protein
MSTFENGWICRECWSANREFDSRCYRCHKDRPAGVPDAVELAGARATSAPSIAHVASETIAEDVAALDSATPAPAPAARPRGRYCLRCGHQFLDGASFCTQCGSRAASEEAVAAVRAAQVPEATPGSAGRRFRVSTPAIKLPHLPRPRPRELVTRALASYSSFVERRAMAWEVGMSALAGAFVLMQLLPRWLPASGGWAGSLSVAITALFVVEYATRLGAAADPRSFVRHHLLELAAVLPPLRALRILRLTWMKWLEPGWRSVAERWSVPARTAWRAVGGQTSLIVAWSVLLLLTAGSVWSFASGGIASDRAVPFALLVTSLALFGGVTGSAVTLLAVRRDIRSGQAADDVRPLATSKSPASMEGGTSQHAPDGWRAAPNSAGG